ncbi:MAG: hypothetical protein JRD89_10650 [Deltaproteobacteria bacterium]|nr:hypothetical protein [Deltaproteobacteria bacterium]
MVVDDRYPEEDEIRQVICEAMGDAGIKGNRLSEDNRKQIGNYFNQFLPQGTKKRVFENIEGDIIPVDTSRMERSGIRVSELERDRTAFLSEDYENEVMACNFPSLNPKILWREGMKLSERLSREIHGRPMW